MPTCSMVEFEKAKSKDLSGNEVLRASPFIVTKPVGTCCSSILSSTTLRGPRFNQISGVPSISKCPRAIGEKPNQPDNRSPQGREPRIMGKEIFFALCVLDVPFGSESGSRNASLMPNPGLRGKVGREPHPPGLFGHDEFFEIQKRALVKEAGFLESCRSKEKST